MQENNFARATGDEAGERAATFADVDLEAPEEKSQVEIAVGSDANNRSEVDDPYGEDDSFVVRIPNPGLFPLEASPDDEVLEAQQTRLVTGTCTICLSRYEAGSDIVWSSNSACEHAFHAECIEKWLLRQREGPLCPCCRRDFVLDPYDVQDAGGATPDRDARLTLHWERPAEIEATDRVEAVPV